MSIVLTDESEYDEIITRVFNDEKIPYFLDRKKYFIENKIAKYIISILNLKARDLNPEDVLYFLKFGDNHIDRSEIELFEKFINQRKIRGKMYFDDKYFTISERYIEKLSPEKKEEMIDLYRAANNVRYYFLNLIVDYYESDKITYINSHIKNLFSILTMEEIKSVIDSFALSQSENEELNTENNGIWESFIDTVNQLSEIAGDLQVSSSEFAKIIIDGFEEQKIGVIPPSQDTVLVGSILRTRANKSKVVFLIGMNDSYIPKKINRSSILTDEEKIELKELDLNLPIKEIEYRQEEMISLYSNLLRAKEKLYISSSAMNSSNSVMTNSIYYNQIMRIYPNIVKINSESFFKNAVYSGSYSIQRMISQLRDINNGIKRISQVDNRELELYYYIKDREKDIAWAINQGLSTNELNRLQDDTAMELYKNLRSLSISRLQTFSRCPYKHFIRYDIKPEEAENYDIDYFEIGNMAHEIMSRYISDYKINPDKFNKLRKADFDDLVEGYFDYESVNIDEQRAEDPKNKMIVDIAKKSISTGAYNITRQMNLSNFKPVYEEVKFGAAQKLPGFKIDLGYKIIELEGIIDRIDRLDDDTGSSIIVIDYKTGSQSFNLNLALAGIDIQLPVYMMAANSMGTNTSVGFFYLPIKEELIAEDSDCPERIMDLLIESLTMDGIVIKDRDIIRSIDKDIENKSTVIKFRGRKRDYMEKDNVLTEEGINKFMEYIVDDIKSKVRRLVSGDIKAFPYILNKRSECVNCDYKAICKFSLKKDKIYRKIENRDWKEFKEE
ncbi:MAG: PD-(D/E)XK nuclease family protein [Tissierellia bacterium]|nr:PD-(D/E)XK nuclease family protein [Tissierellia bacterium]